MPGSSLFVRRVGLGGVRLAAQRGTRREPRVDFRRNPANGLCAKRNGRGERAVADQAPNCAAGKSDAVANFAPAEDAVDGVGGHGWSPLKKSATKFIESKRRETSNK